MYLVFEFEVTLPYCQSQNICLSIYNCIEIGSRSTMFTIFPNTVLVAKHWDCYQPPGPGCASTTFARSFPSCTMNANCKNKAQIQYHDIQ